MAQFASEIVQVNSSVGTIASMVWNPSEQSTTVLGALGSVPAATIFNGLIVANTGANNVYLTSGSVASTPADTGILVPPSSEMYLSGYSGTVGTAGTIWAQTAAGLTSSTQAGMPSVASVI